MSTKELLSQAASNALSFRALEVMDEIEYRPIHTSEDIQHVINMRKKAYIHHDIFSKKYNNFEDEADFDPCHHLIGVYHREKLVASLRLEQLTAENPNTNCMHYFPEVIKPLLDQGLRFIDPTRFVIEPGISQFMPTLPHIVLRLVFMATVHYGFEFSLCMLRRAHSGFYRKVFLASPISPLKTFDNTNDAYALYTTALTSEEAICKNYPLFLSTQTERNLLFGPSKAGYPEMLSVRPTPRIAERLGKGLRHHSA